MYCFSNSFFMVKYVLIFFKVLNIYVLEHFINLIEIFLLTTVDNLVTYIENENCKDFTIEDGERLI